MQDPSLPPNSLTRSKEIDACCDQFEAAWKAGRRPDLAEHLAQAPQGEQLVWLRELIPIEVFYRRRRGEQLQARDLLQTFPNLDSVWLDGVLREAAALPTATLGGRFGETLPPEAIAIASLQDHRPSQGDAIVVPGYDLLGVLGRGAMGIVYKARQLGLGRTVALKMIRSRGEASLEELTRFRSEGAAIAQLQHPNIVQIYDFGEHAGRPFFSLEYIDGGTLAQQIAGVPQPPREAARTLETLARAVHQAHLSGIVHRDLKPANVLMTQHGVPKITDFGLAKQTQADHSATASGMLLGTPQYMAPEQAAGNSSHVGPPADVYALGAILYEMLTGRPPFQAANLPKLLHAITTQDPTSVQLLKRDTPRDLDTICLKCLQKNPTERYESAAALADDLRLFLEDRPIRARASGRWERAWLWCRRNPQVAVPSAALVALLLVVSIASIIAAASFRTISEQAKLSAQEAHHAKKLADLRALDMKLELAHARVNEARMLRRSQRVGQQVQALANIQEARDLYRELEENNYTVSDADWDELRNEAAAAHLVPDIVVRNRWRRDSPPLTEIACDLAHERYLTISPNQPRPTIREIGTGTQYGDISIPQGKTAVRGSLSANGQRLVLHTAADQQVQIWDVQKYPKLLHSMPAAKHWRSLSPDGEVYVSADDVGLTRVIRAIDGHLLAETSAGIPTFCFPFHPTKPWLLLYTTDELKLFDYEQQTLLWERPLPSGEYYLAAWSQDGRWGAVSNTQYVQSFLASTGELLYQPLGNFDAKGVFPIPVSQAGLIGTTDWSGSFRLFHMHTGRPQLKTSARFFDWPRATTADGRITMGYSQNEYVVYEARGSRLTEFALSGTTHAMISPSGQLLVTMRADGEAALYHVPSGEFLAAVPKKWGDMPLGFEPDDRALLIYGGEGLNRLVLQRTEGEPPRLSVENVKQLFPKGMRENWDASRDAKVVVVPNYHSGEIYHFGDDSNAHPTLVQTGRQNDVRHARVSPDGKWAVFGSHVSGQITAYSTTDGKLAKELAAEGGQGRFSPDGRWLAVGKFAGGGELFAVPSWKSRGALPGNSAAFTHNGAMVAVDSETSTISLFETKTLRLIGKLEIQEQSRIQPVAFTPDGRGLVAAAAEDRRLLYFDLGGLRADLAKLDLDWNYPSLPAASPTVAIPIVDFSGVN